MARLNAGSASDIPEFSDRSRRDARIVGIAAGGSSLSDSMDEFSDLDLVIAVEPDHYESIVAERRRIAGSLGELLAAFTGEHVGEPRLLVCFHDGSPILHVTSSSSYFRIWPRESKILPFFRSVKVDSR